MFKGTLKKLLMIALMTTIAIGGVVIGSKEVKASEVVPRELEETEHGNCGAVDGSVKTGGYIDVLSNNGYYIYEEIYYSFNNGVLTIDGRSDTELNRWQTRYIRIWAGYFEGYTNIEKVVINVDGIRLSKDAFKGCTNLTSVIIMPKVIDGFGTSTFEGCTSLKSVIFPNGCHLSDPGIDENCFKDCTSLTSIELPSNSLQLNPGVFQNCRSLKTLVFGQTVELLRTPNAFQGCDNITTIVIKNKNSIWGRNEDENYDLNIERIKKIIESATSANSNFSTITIPTEYVKTIKDAFPDIKVGAFTVTFDENGHGTAPEKIEDIFCYDTISALEEPTASGCTFEGWYTEAECENPWDLDNDKVDSDITLYAKWIEHHGPVSEWSKDANGHYHECVVEGCTEIFDEEAHDYPTDDTCSVCGYDRNHVHRWDEGNWAKDSSSHWHACSGCSEKKDLESHNWNEGVVTKEPTVDEEGIKTYTCTVCGETRTSSIDKLTPTDEPTPEVNPEPESRPSSDNHDDNDDEKHEESSNNSSGTVPTPQITVVNNANQTATVATYTPASKVTVSETVKSNANGTTTTVAALADGTVKETTALPAVAVAINASGNVNPVAPTVVNTVNLVVDKTSAVPNAAITNVTAVVEAKTVNGNVGITPQMVESLKNAATEQTGKSTANVNIKINTIAANGKPLSVIVSSKDLKNNAMLKAYVMDPISGGYIMVDVPSAKYDKKTGFATSGLVSGLEYHFVSASEAKRIENSIVNSVKVSNEFAKPVTVAPGAMLNMSSAISTGFNMSNANKIEYTANTDSVSINPVTGQLIVKGNAKGTVTVSIKITLRNGKTKTIKTKLKIS